MIFVISSFTFLFLSKSSKKNINEPVIYNTNFSVPVKKTINTETDFTFAAKKKLLMQSFILQIKVHREEINLGVYGTFFTTHHQRSIQELVWDLE
jgi:hypothetical protein